VELIFDFFEHARTPLSPSQHQDCARIVLAKPPPLSRLKFGRTALDSGAFDNVIGTMGRYPKPTRAISVLKLVIVSNHNLVLRVAESGRKHRRQQDQYHRNSPIWGSDN
jgi:hypothetical protein